MDAIINALPWLITAAAIFYGVACKIELYRWQRRCDDMQVDLEQFYGR